LQHVKRSFLPSSRKSGREKKQKLAVELGTPRPNGAIHSITIHMGGRLVTWQLAADEDRASHSVDGTRGCCLLTIGKPSHQSSGRQAWEVIAGAHRCLPFGHARHVTHVLRRAAAGQERGARCRRGPVTLTRPVMVAEAALVTVDRLISLLGTRPVRAPPALWPWPRPPSVSSCASEPAGGRRVETPRPWRPRVVEEAAARGDLPACLCLRLRRRPSDHRIRGAIFGRARRTYAAPGSCAGFSTPFFNFHGFLLA